MESIYYNTEGPGSFSGPRMLSNYAKVSLPESQRWLRGQDAYTIHRRKLKKFPRRKTLVLGIDHLWQVDLIDLTSISRYNENIHFLLAVIDCFSRYAFVEPVRRKTAYDVASAFSRIVNSNLRQPTYVQSDKGREFVNAVFQKYLAENGISFYTSENDDVKCALVERFIRTFKSKMWRYFTRNKTLKYIDILGHLTKSYNSTFHSTIKMAPDEVNAENESAIYQRLYPETRRKLKWSLEVGDRVRLSESRRPFRKDYEHNWTKEVFSVTARIPTNPPTYEISDLLGEAIKGRFYSEELQKVTKTDDDLFEIEKVLKTRVRNGKKQFLVRWSGYSSKFDSWVDDIVT